MGEAQVCFVLGLVSPVKGNPSTVHCDKFVGLVALWVANAHGNRKLAHESIGDISLQKCLERLKSWEENPDCPSEISLYYDHAPYSFGFTQRYPDGRTGIVGGLLYHGIPDRSFAVTLQPFHGWQIHT